MAIDDGIFKTKRTVLVGGQRRDIQWWWGIEEKAKRMEKACRPPKDDDPKDTRQLSLPLIKKSK